MDLQKEWRPQIGTILHPKKLDNQRIYRGDLVQTDQPEFLYQATTNNPPHKHTISIPKLDQYKGVEFNKYWTLIRHGSFIWPKDYHRHDLKNDGDIFFDNVTDKYYMSVVEGLTDNDENSSFILKQIDVKSNWMSLLSPFMSSTRLCDLAIPGVHDSGTFISSQKSICLASEMQKFYRISPMHANNWNCTQKSNHKEQLEAGFRNLDLRISYVDGKYCWWHHLTGGLVEESLHQIANFAEYHPKELLFLDFQHFVNFDQDQQQCVTMNVDTLAELLNIILSILGNYLVPNNIHISATSTVSDVYETGKNIIAFMMYETDSNLFWPKDRLHSDWTSAANTESLFSDRSEKLKRYTKEYPDCFTDLSGCVTPENCHRIAALKRLCQRDISLKAQVKGEFPECIGDGINSLTFINAFDNLIDMARYGVNTGGMSVLTSQFCNGNSVHYGGVNKMYHYWLSRPNLYKSNIIYVDDAVHSSSVVDTAIRANLGMIKREVSIINQGNHKNRLNTYHMNNDCLQTKYTVSEKNSFTTPQYRTRICSNSYEKNWEAIFLKDITINEGQFPPDAILYIDVKKESGRKWHELYTKNIIEMIDNNLDLYIRGQDKFVYVSYQYDLFCDKDIPPDSGLVNIIYF